jgi:hypothetical protein
MEPTSARADDRDYFVKIACPTRPTKRPLAELEWSIPLELDADATSKSWWRLWRYQGRGRPRGTPDEERGLNEWARLRFGASWGVGWLTGKDRWVKMPWPEPNQRALRLPCRNCKKGMHEERLASLIERAEAARLARQDSISISPQDASR